MVDQKHDLAGELTAFIDGELTAQQESVVKAALDADPALRALEQRLRRTIEVVEALPQAERAHPALRRNVLAAIEQPTWRKRLVGWLTPGRLAPVGLALAAGVAAVVVVGRPRGGGGPADEVGEDELLMAQHLEVVEDLDLLEVDSPDDLDVIGALHELEVER
jgi:anti-sigma factor RsiW